MRDVRIRDLTMRVRDELAKHNPMKPKGENRQASGKAHKDAGATERANPITRTGPRVPPEPHRAENR